MYIIFDARSISQFLPRRFQHVDMADVRNALRACFRDASTLGFDIRFLPEWESILPLYPV